MAHAEELTASVQAGIMAYRNLDHPESCELELLGHFDANNSASGFERNFIENVAAKESEVTVDIADREAERPAHCPAVEIADEDTVPGIRALDLVSIDHIDIGPHLRQQIVDLAHIVLPVTISIEDEVLSGVCEASNEGGTVAEIFGVMNSAEEWQLGAKTIKNLR